MSSSAIRKLGDTGVAFVAAFWLGILMGVSFLATPVKFQADTLTLPVALEVGRVTFALFSKIEWGLYLLLLITAILSRSSFFRWGCLLVLLALQLTESLWLLPVLDARVGDVMAGRTIPDSSHHFLFIATELCKALLIFAISVSGFRSRAVASS